MVTYCIPGECLIAFIVNLLLLVVIVTVFLLLLLRCFIVIIVVCLSSEEQCPTAACPPTHAPTTRIAPPPLRPPLPPTHAPTIRIAPPPLRPPLPPPPHSRTLLGKYLHVLKPSDLTSHIGKKEDEQQLLLERIRHVRGPEPYSPSVVWPWAAT